MTAEPVFVYAQLNAKIMPLDRGDRFEDPLNDALMERGEVTGGGTMQTEAGEIEYCGIDIDLYDVEQGIPFVTEVLTRCGAPKGSKLQYRVGDEQIEVPFGNIEGLGVYLNGTDLPDEVYRDCDMNLVYQQIDELLGEKGSIQGYWQGPTETALYLYGPDFGLMLGAIKNYIEKTAICQKARLVRIA